MMTVQQVLDRKGRDIWSIAPDDSVFDAINLMAEKGIGATLVVEGDQLVGILSERDYARKVILRGKSSRTTKAREIMTEKVLYVSPHRYVEECMALMTDKRIRHLPVMDNGKLVGMLSIGDIVKTILADQKFIIEQLENYIKGY